MNAAVWPWVIALSCAVAGVTGWVFSGRVIARCADNEERSLAHVPGDDFPDDDWCAQ